jgi:hypothetical protein
MSGGAKDGVSPGAIGSGIGPAGGKSWVQAIEPVGRVILMVS